MIRYLSRVAPMAFALLLPLAAHASSVRSASLRPLALQGSDVPRNCKLASGTVVTNSYVVGTRRFNAAQLAAFGRITGYADTYNCAGTRGMQQIASEVVQFKTASGAQRYYQSVTPSYIVPAQRSSASFRRFSTKGLGNASVAFSYEAKSLRANLQLIQYALAVFRQGRYDALIEIAGPGGTWKASAVTSMAHAMDLRIRRVR